MNKNELLADIEVKADGEILSTSLVETVGLVNRYMTNVFTTGKDSDGGPIAQKRNISWYVHDEGGVNEKAYYCDNNWKNPEDKDVTGNTLLAIHGIIINGNLQARVNSAICKGIRTNGGIVAKEYARNQGGIISLFMAWVASNATIQSNGGKATDSDIEYVVLTEAWSNIATLLGN